MSTEVVDGTNPKLIPLARAFLRDHLTEVEGTPCAEGIQEERKALPGPFAAPLGALLVAIVRGGPGGMVAVREPREAGGPAELCRLFVRPKFRGHGVGSKLVRKALKAARKAGHTRMICHVLPKKEQLKRILENYGFEPQGGMADPLSDEPITYEVDLTLELEKRDRGW